MKQLHFWKILVTIAAFSGLVAGETLMRCKHADRTEADDYRVTKEMCSIHSMQYAGALLNIIVQSNGAYMMVLVSCMTFERISKKKMFKAELGKLR